MVMNWKLEEEDKQNIHRDSKRFEPFKCCLLDIIHKKVIEIGLKEQRLSNILCVEDGWPALRVFIITDGEIMPAASTTLLTLLCLN